MNEKNKIISYYKNNTDKCWKYILGFSLVLLLIGSILLGVSMNTEEWRETFAADLVCEMNPKGEECLKIMSIRDQHTAGTILTIFGSIGTFAGIVYFGYKKYMSDKAKLQK